MGIGEQFELEKTGRITPEEGYLFEELIISVRQPWAWLLIRPDIVGAEARKRAYMEHLIKDIENRDWATRVRGRILIHASKGMTHDEYDDCCEFVNREISPDIIIPDPARLERGGILGTINITGCVTKSESPWFVGGYGFVSADAEPRAFFPCRGRLGFFRA